MRLVLCAALIAAAPSLAAADDADKWGHPTDAPPPMRPLPGRDDNRTDPDMIATRPPTGPDIVVVTPGARSTTNIVVLAGVAGLGALAGGFGVYWHLDSRSIANDLSASKPTNKAWSVNDQARYDRGQRDITKTAVAYSLGGACLIGAAIALIVTEPKSTRSVIHPHTASFAPVPGGAVVGAGWSF